MAHGDLSPQFRETVLDSQDESGTGHVQHAVPAAETVFERIVKAQTTFCFFLRDLYVPDEAILVPPELGWPEITKESFVLLDKSGIVINVLRHLTYINHEGSPNPYHFRPEISLMDWRDSDNIKDITDGNAKAVRDRTQGYDNEVDQDTVGLAVCSEDMAIPLLSCMNGFVSFRDDHLTMSIEDYFEGIKQMFIRMEQLPEYEGNILTEDIVLEDGEMKNLREIYRRHGWPDNFDKAKCAAEVKELYEIEQQICYSDTHG